MNYNIIEPAVQANEKKKKKIIVPTIQALTK